MKVSLSWLKELVKYDLSSQKLANILSLKSIGVKQQTDDFLELDLTYNRGDLLSMRGVAREITAITNSALSFETNPAPKFDLPKIPVKVESSSLCPLYTVAKIENLKVEHSPDTWVKKLSDSGIRSVNNIADVTNLIMLEYGQPLHAFDIRGVKDETIIVRKAKKEERITTLDGKTRDLNPEDLLIADSRLPLGIAGVMGGKDSEVSNSTNTILLEAAIFDPVSIRNTSKRHGLQSEASKRFQHGLTKINLLQALSKAIKMYESLGGKLTAISMVGDLEDKPKTIHLTQQKINTLLGVDISPDEVEKSLQSLGFHSFESEPEGSSLRVEDPKGAGSNSWEVSVPYFRLDIEIEEDLIEEVARMYGYERIEGIKLRNEKIPALDQSLQNSIYNLQVKLKDLGLTEVQTYSFYSSKVINDLRLKINDLIKIANPISSETEYLRNNLWPNLVEVVGKNLRQGYKDIAIFEIGKIYLPEEKYHLAIALMNGSDNPLEELVVLFQGLSLHPGDGKLNPASLFHPTRVIKNMAEVHLRVLNKLGIEKRIAVLEISLPLK